MLAVMSQLEAVPAWVLLAVALALLGLDLLLTNDGFSTWLGVGVGAAAAASFAGLGGELQVLAFFLIGGASLLFARTWLSRAPRLAAAHSSVVDLTGVEGSVIDVDPSKPSEGRAALVQNGEWRIRHETGNALRESERVRVVGREGLLLLVATNSA